MKAKQKEVELPIKTEPTEQEIKDARERINLRMVTSWLRGASTCGESCYNVRTNEGWCREEVARLKEKHVRACVVKRGDFVSVFRLSDGETVQTINELIDTAKIEIKEGN